MLKIVGHNDDEFMTLYGIWKNPFSDFSEETGWLYTGYTKIEQITQWKHEQTKQMLPCAWWRCCEFQASCVQQQSSLNWNSEPL